MLVLCRAVARFGSRPPSRLCAPHPSSGSAARFLSFGWPLVPPVKLTEQQAKSRDHLVSPLVIVPRAASRSTSADMTIDKRIGFLGSGQMAEALARGLIKRGLVAAERIACNDPNPARKELFKSFGAVPYDSNADVRRRGGHRPHGGWRCAPEHSMHSRQPRLSEAQSGPGAPQSQQCALPGMGLRGGAGAGGARPQRVRAAEVSWSAAGAPLERHWRATGGDKPPPPPPASAAAPAADGPAPPPPAPGASSPQAAAAANEFRLRLSNEPRGLPPATAPDPARCSAPPACAAATAAAAAAAAPPLTEDAARGRPGEPGAPGAPRCKALMAEPPSEDTELSRQKRSPGSASSSSLTVLVSRFTPVVAGVCDSTPRSLFSSESCDASGRFGPIPAH
ncbi:Pyrroline-5-carboxylate reductase [Tetrabaena socialis]|uniref:Pyrroline-5-carboxylate reductase n=1 Tax=Tetrabaena socialis TaxID=47790 RepID=A0A2J8AGH6_9CHLO|nr:Pyrroline-5-carboxylate reductase [Tetrabaena socialis]|eukprot:PNH11620.1 Pyrroline-5-carboxylate reductase [Tetrabaena socialis]